MSKQFIKEAKEVRESFVEIAGQYSISDNLKLRTEIDSLLIMYDQALQMLSERQTSTEVVRSFSKQDMIDVLQQRKDELHPAHKYERERLTQAINTIKKLVPDF